MKLRLNRIAAGDTHHELRFRPGALPRLAELIAADQGTVSASLDLSRVEDIVEVRGAVRASLTLPCTRCLEPTAWTLDETFTAAQAPVEWQRRLGEEVQLTGSDLDLDFFEGDELDLGQLLEEHVLLNLPQSLYCRDKCAGLCPGCGRNLNQSECICPPQPKDHPFAGLRALLNDTKRNHQR